MNWIRVGKTLSYRVLGIIGTFIVVFILSGQVDLSLKVGALDLVLKLIFYYGHEVVWDKIHNKVNGDKNEV